MGSVKAFASFVGKPLDEVSERDVTNYLYDLKKSCSDRSLCRHAYALKSFFEWLGRHDVASRIPTPSTWNVSTPKWLEEDKVETIVNAAFAIRDKALLQAAYDLALRVSEVCLLDRDFLSLRSRTMKVLRLKRRGFREDILPIEDRTAELLKQYLDGRLDANQALFVARSVKGGVSRMSHDAVNYAFKRACKAAGIENVTFHVLRHSKLTHMAISGADIATIAKFAGHSNINSTLVYIHLAADYLRRRMGQPAGTTALHVRWPSCQEAH